MSTEPIVLTIDETAARIIISALKQYERSFFTGDPAGRIQSANAMYIRQSLEDAVPAQVPTQGSSPNIKGQTQRPAGEMT